MTATELSAERRPIAVHPITPMQNGMLFHAETVPGRGIDIEHIVIDLHEDLDPARLLDAFDVATQAHDILRSAFRWEGIEKPERLVFDQVSIPVTHHDWSDDNEAAQADQLTALRIADRSDDFDLTTPPLQRLHVIQLGAAHWTVLWSFHHILLDGRSFPLVLADVFAHYDHGREPDVRPGFDVYVDSIVDLDHTAALETWTSLLEGLEPPQPMRVQVETLLDTAPDPIDGNHFGAVTRTLDVEQTRRLRSLAEACGVSLNNVLQGAWSLLLHRYRAAEGDAANDVIFGTTRACRHVNDDAADIVGLLINTVPLRISVDRTQSVEQLLHVIRDRQFQLRAIETTPLHLIHQAAGAEAGTSLFESLVVYDDASLDERMSPIAGDRRSFDYVGQTNFPLTLLGYGDDEMLLRLEFARTHLTDEAAERMLGQLEIVLASMAGDPEAAVGDLEYLSSSDLELVDRWNDTAVDYDDTLTLVDLFERQVDATPNAPAVRFGDRSMTYAEFNEAANRLAFELARRGIGAEATVGVYADRSLEMLVAIYGTLKAGAAYVPLEPSYPTDRLRHQIEDSATTIAIAAGGTAHTAARLEVDVIDLDRPDAPHLVGPTSNPVRTAEPSNAAYVIFTSGSTGRPKGVLNEHGGIVNRLLWMQDAFGLDDSDVVLQKTPFTFDVSVWELFWPLQTGACLVIAPPNAHMSPVALTELIVDHAVTTAHFVPSMLVHFVEEPTTATCRSLRRVICSGEALPRAVQDQFWERFDGDNAPELHNLYGPTEAAVDVSWWACRPDSPLAYIPIGAAIANTSLHILDADLQPVPPGAAGEINIGGVQVARGYVNRPDLTDERFVCAPEVTDHRLYRTGDLGRFRADGSIEYLGRTDHQVKIRGFRIELGEIEIALGALDNVAHCVVVDRPDPRGDKQLVAYVVTSGTATDDTVVDCLRGELSATLADYMIPAAFVIMDALPLSGNGKIDRKRLPEPDVLGAAAPDEIPAGLAESQIASMWADLLEVDADRIQRSLPFFQSGGHSLLAIRLAAKLTEAFERQVSIAEVLEHSTVAAQAAFLTGDADQDAELRESVRVARARREVARRRQQTGRRAQKDRNIA